MKTTIFISTIFIIFVGVSFIFLAQKEAVHEPPIQPQSDTTIRYKDIIAVITPQEGWTIESPFVIKGEARGMWYFEADFPVILVNWDGLIIDTVPARTQDDWMTEEFVPFEAILEFDSPYKEDDPDFMKNGTIILQKDNPTGLPEFDDALEIPVQFKATKSDTYNGVYYPAGSLSSEQEYIFSPEFELLAECFSWALQTETDKVQQGLSLNVGFTDKADCGLNCDFKKVSIASEGASGACEEVFDVPL